MRIVGLDLAWSGRKPTGLCVLRAGGDGTVLERLECIDGDAAEVFSVLEALGRDVVAGIDAPLIVGTERRAEAELARAYGRRGVYAYAARMDFLERHGIAEGVRLGSALAGAGWSLAPLNVSPAVSGRLALEVFPHATIVSLLGAEAALKYKKGSLASRREPLRVFQELLAAYAAQHLPCLLQAEALTTPVEGLSGRQMKALEDRLDAMACAIAAHHAWKHGSDGLEVFGDADHGYIAVPRPAIR